MEYTELGNLILDGKWPFLMALFICCVLIAFQSLYLMPEIKRLKAEAEEKVQLRSLQTEMIEIHAMLEKVTSTDTKSGNAEIIAELRISIEEIKAVASTISHIGDLTSRLESDLRDSSRSNEENHRDAIRTIQELHRSIADMNSRLMFVSNSLCSPFPRTDPTGFNNNGIR